MLVQVLVTSASRWVFMKTVIPRSWLRPMMICRSCATPWGVQTGGRFVQEQHGRFVHDSLGEPGPLARSLAERGHPFLAVAGEVHGGKGRPDPCCGVRHAGKPGEEHQVFFQREVVIKLDVSGR